MRFRSPVSVLLLFALVAASAQPAHAAPTQLSETQVVASAVPAAATCDIYPLALPAEVVTTATRGTTIPAINLGSDSGNFGFVTWTGDNSAGALAGSLTAPGDADTYVSAADPEDTQVDIGDWVQGVPGAKNSKAVRTAMNDLYGRDIVVPTYAETRGTGSNLEYRVASFEVIRILDYHWKGDKWISIDHVGTTTCYGSPPVANDVTVTTTANEPVRLPLSGVDPDGEGVSLSISTAPSHGTVTSPFSDFTYSPDADFVGTDYFYYVARDGSSESSPAIGIVVVSEPNSAPNVVSQPTQSGVLGAGYQYAVEAQDPDGDVLRYSLEDTSGTFAIGRDSGVVKGVLRDSTAVESVSGANTNCLAYTYDAGAIDLKQVWWWKTNLNGMGINVTGPPIVGRMYDVNGDGVIDTNDPPIVVFASGGASAQRLIALNGATGEQLWVNTDRNFAGAAQAAGDLDGDGDWEIVKLLRDHRQTLVALDHLGNILWEAPTGPYASSPNASDNMAIADLDGDGKPEIIHGNRVFSNTGELLWKGGAETGGHATYGISSTPVDLDNDGRQEVVAGLAIYNADGTTRARNKTIVNRDGFSAVADFDGDGAPEIVFVGTGKLYMLDRNMTEIWKLNLPGTKVGGSPVIVDVDGDGIPEIGVGGDSQFTMVDASGNILWANPIADYSSGRMGASAFDFNGNGRPSILYFDEQNFYIYDGASGDIQAVIPNGSATGMEYAYVADITGDGQANVMLPQTFRTTGSGGLRVFESGSQPWMPARPLWNQHVYSVTNINDDGSIPSHPIPNWLGDNNLRVNSFADQQPFGLPDFAPSALEITPDSRVSALITNRGLAASGGTIDARFYRVDSSGARTLVGTAAVASLAPGESVRVTSPATELNAATTAEVVAEVVPTGGLDQCNTDNDWASAQVLTARATDPSGAFAEQTFAVATRRPPVNFVPDLDSAPDQTVLAGKTLAVSMHATDPDRGDQLRYSLVDAPHAVWINAVTGEVFWPTGSNDIGTHEITVRVADLYGGSDLTTFTATVEENPDQIAPPAVHSVPPPRAVAGGAFRYAISASSNAGSLTYSVVSSPRGLSVDRHSGRVSWDIGLGQAGDHYVSIQVTDPTGLFRCMSSLSLSVDGRQSSSRICGGSTSRGRCRRCDSILRCTRRTPMATPSRTPCGAGLPGSRSTQSRARCTGRLRASPLGCIAPKCLLRTRPPALRQGC